MTDIKALLVLLEHLAMIVKVMEVSTEVTRRERLCYVDFQVSFAGFPHLYSPSPSRFGADVASLGAQQREQGKMQLHFCRQHKTTGADFLLR